MIGLHSDYCGGFDGGYLRGVNCVWFDVCVLWYWFGLLLGAELIWVGLLWLRVRLFVLDERVVGLLLVV